ncbi:hypothetical protein EI555_012357 [Monodon monoceros]|uniref:Uncharacterized protein n=1 Tax=Monodon monoceros TaxID=40151 RepID=A0A4V5P9R5_MONMO|nr:hypothetical protein EI555_012357 [Monodon monoceros]
MWPPGFDPAQLRLPCRPRPEVNHPRVGSVAEMPWDAHLVAGSWGQLPCSGFMVREGGLRGAGGPCPQAAAGSSAPVLRVLLTTVTCLRSILLLASLLLFLVPPSPAAPPLVTAGKRLPGLPGTGRAQDTVGTHTPPPRPPPQLVGGDGLEAAWLRGPAGAAPSAEGPTLTGLLPLQEMWHYGARVTVLFLKHRASAPSPSLCLGW